MQRIEPLVKFVRHLRKMALVAGGCAPAQPGTIVTISGGKRRQMWLQDTPVQRRCGDSGLKDNGRSSDAELLNVRGPSRQFDQGSWRAIFAAIKPETEKLKCGLQEQDGSDDG